MPATRALATPSLVRGCCPLLNLAIPNVVAAAASDEEARRGG